MGKWTNLIRSAAGPAAGSAVKSAVTYTIGIVAAVLASGAPLAARAAQAGPQADGSLNVYESSALVGGRQTAHAEFTIPVAGKVTIKLRDLEWPERLATLSFLLTDTHDVFQRLDEPGTLSFDLDAPGQFFAFVAAATQDVTDMGLYSLTVSVGGPVTPAATSVPVPAAGWLLLSALAGFGALGRSNGRKIEGAPAYA